VAVDGSASDAGRCVKGLQIDIILLTGTTASLLLLGWGGTELMGIA
jgi:hypothetical protein